MTMIEYGVVYDKLINRRDLVAMEAARRLCLARARWHAKSNNITITDGPFFKVMPTSHMDWDGIYLWASVAWHYTGVTQ